MLQRVALHLDKQHSKTVNVDDVYHTAKLLSPLMATYDELTANPHWPLACCCNQNVCVYPQLHPQSEWMRLGYAARSGSSKEKLPPLFQNGFQYECHLWTPSVYDVSRFSCFIKKRSVLSLVVKKKSLKLLAQQVSLAVPQTFASYSKRKGDIYQHAQGDWNSSCHTCRTLCTHSILCVLISEVYLTHTLPGTVYLPDYTSLWIY